MRVFRTTIYPLSLLIQDYHIYIPGIPEKSKRLPTYETFPESHEVIQQALPYFQAHKLDTEMSCRLLVIS